MARVLAFLTTILCFGSLGFLAMWSNRLAKIESFTDRHNPSARRDELGSELTDDELDAWEDLVDRYHS